MAGELDGAGCGALVNRLHASSISLSLAYFGDVVEIESLERQFVSFIEICGRIMECSDSLDLAGTRYHVAHGGIRYAELFSRMQKGNDARIPA